MSTILLKKHFITDFSFAILWIFPNSSKNLWEGPEYRAFKLCAVIVIFIVCLELYFFRTLKK